MAGKQEKRYIAVDTYSWEWVYEGTLEEIEAAILEFVEYDYTGGDPEESVANIKVYELGEEIKFNFRSRPDLTWVA